MKNWLLVVLLVMVVSTTYAGKKEVFKCEKQSTPLKINGKVDNPSQKWNFDEKQGIYYRLSNDNKNLYVQMKVDNKAAVRKIALFGFYVWIDPASKARNTLGINYPVGSYKKMREQYEKATPEERAKFQKNRNRLQNRDRIAGTREQMIQRRIEHTNKEFLEEQITGTLKGFEKKGLNDVFFGSGDINALAQLNDKGELVYEAVIPLKSIFKNPEKYLKNQTPFSVVLESGYFEQNMSRMGENRMSAGMSGGRMGSGMGSMRGAQRGGAYIEGMMLPAKIKLKRVVLNNN